LFLALNHSSISPSTIRRRPGSRRKGETPEPTPTPAPRRTRISRKPVAEDTYQPAGRGITEEGDEEQEEDWESAALVWGEIIAGGLGFGSSGVYGGEIRTR
jgi:hypothetical protein